MRVLNIVTIILDALLLAVCAVVKLNYYITEPKFSSSGPNIYDVIWIGWMVISILITLSPMLTRIIVLCFVKYKKQLLALLIPLFVWCGDLMFEFISMLGGTMCLDDDWIDTAVTLLLCLLLFIIPTVLSFVTWLMSRKKKRVGETS